MPAKYAHTKRRLNAAPIKGQQQRKTSATHRAPPNPHVDKSLSHTLTAIAELERAISRILLLRYEHDIRRLYSTRLHAVARNHLPKLVLDSTTHASPGWLAINAHSDPVKDFFRSAIAMDLRQAGERVATKSVLWSYTALRHFALSNNVHVCQKRGLHSLRLLPHFAALDAHRRDLEAIPHTSFAKPAHLPSLDDAHARIQNDLARRKSNDGPAWHDWQPKARIGYDRLVDSLWRVASEFDVRGYGNVLRDKLTTKWCDCGCSTDHLGDVCERTVRDEEGNRVRSGKVREWDGRGSGVYGWQTEDEEDVWDIDLDFGTLDLEQSIDTLDPDMSIGELIEWRYFKAERAKELGNKHFKAGDYDAAIEHYSTAYDIEPELPHYQLNMAAAHLKLSNWMAAEKACNLALTQHRSGKGYWRRAKARRMLGRSADAIRDLRAVLRLQPENVEALEELASLLPHEGHRKDTSSIQKPPDWCELPQSSSSSMSMSDSNRSDDTSGGSGSGSRSSGSRGGDDLESAKLKGQAHTGTYTPPFAVHALDGRRLKIGAPPLQLEMPVIETKTKRAKGKGAGTVTTTFEVQAESYAYPSWERCKVERCW